jgi:hypothetical protein
MEINNYINKGLVDNRASMSDSFNGQRVGDHALGFWIIIV